MPKNPVFDQARGKCTPELVESLFASSGAYWDGAEYWTLNPLRGDGAVGSFSINGHTGLWSDFASGDKGDLLKLMVDTGNASSLTAAAGIVVAAIGGTVAQSADGAPAKSHLDKPAKVKAVIPAPATDEAKKLLNNRVKGKWAVENRGNAVGGWTWLMADGKPWVCTVRYDKPDGGKDVIAHYWGEDGKWHEGNPIPTGRHLYRLDQIAKAPEGTKILIVEGEKKASREKSLPAWLLTTWIGGAAAFTKTDWAPLESAARRGDVLIWPDADEPGLKAAMGIAKRLPGAVVMDIKGRAQGWDLADAIDEGIDPVEFIAACPVIGGPPPAVGAETRPDDGAPFLCLGYDKAAYYFMRRKTRTLFSIGMGSWNSSKLGEIAALSWWMLMGMTGDEGGIKAAVAQDYVVGLQHEVGFFDPKKIRGAGVWRDSQGIILNDGRRIITMDGRRFDYDSFPSSYYYVPSLVAFGEMHGPESTDEDGAQLEELFTALEFEEVTQAILLMGWCLIAPFGGVLAWRPHVWLTGQAGSGKSWAVDNVVVPLCGPFAFVGSGKDTEAGIRWALDQDARPGIMKEMEGKNEASRKKISSLVDLIRNLSDDSGTINISQAGGGVKSFNLRSMFLLSSKVSPSDDDSVSSRITVLMLKKSKDEAAKISTCVRLVADLLDDPGRFTRRIFHSLGRIMADIEYLRTTYLAAFHSKRAADQLAPLLAVAWAVQSSRSIRESGPWLDKWLVDLSSESKITVADHDAFMSHLVAVGVRNDEGKTRTIAELLERVADDKDGADSALSLLERHGLTLRRRYKTTPFVLSIATELPALASLFKDTAWGDAYGNQIKRNPLTIEGPTRQIRMASGKPRCHDLDWERFREKYLGREDDGYAQEPPF